MSCIERNSAMVKCFMVIMSLVLACPVSKAELPPSIARLPLFERAVAVVRHFERAGTGRATTLTSATGTDSGPARGTATA